MTAYPSAWHYMREQAADFRRQAESARRSDAFDTARDFEQFATFYEQAALALAARTKGIELETR